MNSAVNATASGAGAGPVDGPIRVEFVIEGPSLFWLSLRMALLTVLTLGFYRFWMSTNLRRYYWNAVQVMGDPFEYTGKGLEKLLGFLLALVILAVYLTFVNLILAFLGLANFDDPVALQIMINLSFLASLPLIYFATYRAWRYILSRTRWRGIRFGMDQAAWAYTWRAMGLTLLTIVTLGFLYPYQHFKLTKFMVDRTWFGTLRFQQGGAWTELLGYWAWIFAIIAVVAVLFGIGAATGDEAILTVAAIIFSFGYLAIFILFIRYGVASFRYLWKHRTLGQARFHNDVDTGEIIGITIGGSMGAGMCAFFIAFFVTAILALIVLGSIVGADFEAFERMIDGGDPSAAWPFVFVMVFGYLLLFVLAFAFTQIFLTRPILRRKVAGMQIAEAASLAASQQRAHDQALEAGGFADALGVDIGAGL